MRKCILILAASALVLQVSAQTDYKVIKVNGTIVLKAKGVSLQTGTEFSENEDLLFRTEDATAALINPQRGRVVITSRDHNLTASRSNYLPSMYNISTRGAAMLGSEALAVHFSGRRVIIKTDKALIDPSVYPMDKNNFFFLRYKFKGEEINKKLDFSGDTLIINRSSLLTVDGKSIPSADNTKIKLFYRKGKESILVNEFDLILPDEKQLAEEVKVILSTLKGKEKEQLLKETGSYIEEFYGNISPEQLSSWLKETFSVR